MVKADERLRAAQTKLQEAQEAAKEAAEALENARQCESDVAAEFLKTLKAVVEDPKDLVF